MTNEDLDYKKAALVFGLVNLQAPSDLVAVEEPNGLFKDLIEPTRAEKERQILELLQDKALYEELVTLLCKAGWHGLDSGYSKANSG